ncbi:hypothetical protein AAC387_Pa09g2148 [Persea americana]
MGSEWYLLQVAMDAIWDSIPVFMLLPNQIEGPVPLAREPMYRLPHPLLLPDLCHVPRIQRAQEPWFRHGNRMASERGKADPRNYNLASICDWSHEPLDTIWSLN